MPEGAAGFAIEEGDTPILPLGVLSSWRRACSDVARGPASWRRGNEFNQLSQNKCRSQTAVATAIPITWGRAIVAELPQ